MEQLFSPRPAIRTGLAAALLLAGASGAFAQTPASTATANPSFQAAMEKIAAMKTAGVKGAAFDPQALGSFSSDLVYTPVTPCRIVDSRFGGGALAAGATKTYDVDGSDFSGQGGNAGSCGIPFNVAAAVAMTITAVGPSGAGNFAAWGLGTRPNSSVVNFGAGQNLANTTIIPVVPGSGTDFSVRSTVNSNIVIDVVGYFSRPVATALECTSVSSGAVSVPYNSYTSVDAFCPAGYAVTGGGTFPIEGTLGRTNIWTDGSPISGGWRTWVDNQTGSARSIATYAQCCRVPGR